MFKNIIITAIILIILCGIILFSVFINSSSNELMNPDHDDRDVLYVSGCHHEVWREDGYIAYSEDVSLDNKTDYNLWGYLIADVRREKQYVDEEFIYAYDNDTNEKLLVFIPAKSQIKLSNIYFRAKSSSESESLRTDRNPLDDVLFEEIKREEPNEETTLIISP